MKKTILAIGVILVLTILLFVLTGCGKSKNKIVGSWKYNGGSIEAVYKFNEDNTGSYSYSGTKREFKYEDSGTEVKIIYDSDTEGSTYNYRIEGDKLIISDSFGSEVEYVKK